MVFQSESGSFCVKYCGLHSDQCSLWVTNDRGETQSYKSVDLLELIKLNIFYVNVLERTTSPGSVRDCTEMIRVAVDVKAVELLFNISLKDNVYIATND